MYRNRKKNFIKAFKSPKILLFFCLLVGAFLLFVNLSQPPMWTDELLSLKTVKREDFSLTTTATIDARHPPLYYLFLYCWYSFFGSDPAVVRVLSALFALVALVLYFKLLQGNLYTPATLISFLLLATSPFLILYARMARYFSLTLLLTIWASMTFLNSFNKPIKFTTALLFVVSHILLLLADYTAGLSIFIAEIVYGFFFAKQKCYESIIRLLLWIPVGVPILIYFFLYSNFASIGASHETVQALTVKGIFFKFIYPLWDVAFGETLSFHRWYLIIPGGICFLWIGFKTFQNITKASDFMRFSIIVVVSGILTVNVLFITVTRDLPIQHAAKLTLFTSPFFYAICGYVLASFIPRTRRTVFITVILLCNFVGLFNYYTMREFHNPNYAIPWDKVAQSLASESQENDLICTFDENLEFYFNRANGKSNVYLISGLASIDYIKELIHSEKPSNVWLTQRDRGHSVYDEWYTKLVGILSNDYQQRKEVGFGPQSPQLVKLREKLLNRPMSFYAVILKKFERHKE